MPIELFMPIELHHGDCLDILKTLPDASAQTCVTSPPYFGLRDYSLPATVWGGDSDCGHDWRQERWYTENSAGVSSGDAFHAAGQSNAARLKAARWRQSDTCSACGAWRGSLGLEPTPGMFVAHLVELFREVRRVLRGDGTLWLNLGDSYASAGGPRAYGSSDGGVGPSSAPQGRQTNTGLKSKDLKSKDLMGIPWRVAFALQEDGWYLRSDIIWAKPNPMPESVTDRPTRAHEYIFLLSKSPRYYYDHEAVKEPLTSSSITRLSQPNFDNQTGGTKDYGGGTNDNRSCRRALVNLKGRAMCPQVGTSPGQFAALTGRNRRTVWTVAPKPFKGAHFATFPPDLIRPCVLAGCPEHSCPSCGAPWERVTRRTDHGFADRTFRSPHETGTPGMTNGRGATTLTKVITTETTGWQPRCACGRDPVPGVVLDPFAGAGTVGLVCAQTRRSHVGVELNAEYLEMARSRVAAVGGV